MLEEVLWGGLGIDELFDMWTASVKGIGTESLAPLVALDSEAAADEATEFPKGFVVMLDLQLAFKIPFNLGALETWICGGLEWSAGIAMILGPPALCTGQDLRRGALLVLEAVAKGPSPQTMASRSESTAEAMESGRGRSEVVLQVFLWLLEVRGGMAFPKGSI